MMSSKRSEIKIQKVVISAKDVASSSTNVNVVDPWVPRVRHDDEYLEQGLDFSRHLSASHDFIDNESVQDGDDGYNAITPVVSRNVLAVGDVGAVRLAKALSFNTNLVHLNLSGNEIGAEGALAIAKSLYSPAASSTAKREKYQSNTVLKSLNLSNNLVSDEGANAFANALRYNTSLTVLNLSRNGINTTGVVGLLEQGLINNQTLKFLKLEGNLGQNKDGIDFNAEIKQILKSLGKVLISGCKLQGGCALEVMELHSGSYANSEIDNESACLLTHAMYVVRKKVHESESSEESKYILSKSSKLQNHRFRRLTLPQYLENESTTNGKKEGKSNQSEIFLRILRFNEFYHPIMQLHDILKASAPTREQKETSLKLPYYLHRDEKSGAMIALLPSDGNVLSFSINDIPGSHSSTPLPSGIELKVMPRLISFTLNECKLETLWNVLRYRPDVLRFAGKGSKQSNKTIRAACGRGGVGCVVM